MLTQDKEVECFEIARAFETLYNSHCLEPVLYAIRFWNNYELHFMAEIFEGDSMGDIAIIAQNIANNKDTNDFTSTIKKVVVSRINSKGMELFPYEDKMEKRFQEHRRSLGDKLISELNINNLEKEELERLIKSVEESLKNKKDDSDRIHQVLSIDNQRMLDRSTFYYLNETVANIFSGGIWNNTVDWAFQTEYNCRLVEEDHEPPFDYYKDWATLSNHENIKLYIDAVYISSTSSPLTERIAEITWPCCRNLINNILRGFHDGKIYCPLGMLELIPQYEIPFTVREEIKKLVEIIESLEDFEKEAYLKYLLKQLDEKGSFYIASILEYFYHIYLTNTNIPSFFDKLNSKQKDQFRQIQQLNSSLHPPLTNKEQEDSDYSKYFFLYFSFVNTIISSVFGDRITISDFVNNNNDLKSRIDNSDFNEIKQYRNKKYDNSGKRYLDLFIDIKHPIKVNLDYGMIPIFNKNTEKVLGIILKYKK